VQLGSGGSRRCGPNIKEMMLRLKHQQKESQIQGPREEKRKKDCCYHCKKARKYNYFVESREVKFETSHKQFAC